MINVDLSTNNNYDVIKKKKKNEKSFFSSALHIYLAQRTTCDMVKEGKISK